MAEFVEVIGRARRICDTYEDCRKCPLYDDGCLANFTVESEAAETVEKIVMDWAKEHPEPMYPSWREGWRQLFPEATKTICPLMCATGSVMDEYQLKCYGSNCYECKRTQMNAEVAKKLGIKPIGGK